MIGAAVRREASDPRADTAQRNVAQHVLADRRLDPVGPDHEVEVLPSAVGEAHSDLVRHLLERLHRRPQPDVRVVESGAQKVVEIVPVKRETRLVGPPCARHRNLEHEMAPFPIGAAGLDAYAPGPILQTEPAKRRDSVAWQVQPRPVRPPIVRALDQDGGPTPIPQRSQRPEARNPATHN